MKTRHLRKELMEGLLNERMLAYYDIDMPTRGPLRCDAYPSSQRRAAADTRNAWLREAIKR